MARRNRMLGYSNGIDVVFLEGFAGLDERYAAELRECGLQLHDAGDLYRRQAERLPVLRRFGAFEQRCLLRWLVLEEFFAGEPLLHLDGDVVPNECPAALARLFDKWTLVLQGCPAVTAISDSAWYRQYADELAAFAQDIEGYSSRAWRARDGWEASAAAKWAGSRYRRIIASDQDLISHLIHTDRLTQASPAAFIAAAPDHVFFENPLLLGELVPVRPLAYRRAEGVDYLNDRRVAVWHMQTEWCRYLGRHMLREWMGPLMGWGPDSFGRRDWAVLCGKIVQRISGGRIHDRASVYRRFFAEGDFSKVFTAARWWEPHVFGERG
jgi:hypothetical protein